LSHRSNRTVGLFSLGCKVNQADADEWTRGFRDLGYEIVPFDEVADAYVVNTCTVTHVADRKSRQLLRQARRLNPAALVVATGCYASVAPDEVARIVGVDLVVGGDDKPRLVQVVHEALEGAEEQPGEAIGGELRRFAGRTRAFVKIGDGCDKFCAFCIVPYARGRARSLAFDEAIGKVAAMAAEGYREVVLTAVHMGTYGQDLEPRRSLRELVDTALEQTPVERLRLSSIEPEDFDLSILDLWRRQEQQHSGRLCRHFHLALDSGCDATLARMRRRYTTSQYAELVGAIREAVPGAGITTDVMTGFPGETDSEHAESRAFVEAMAFSQIHVFKYSQRRRTAAAKHPDQVSEDAKRQRTEAMLREAAESARRFRSALVGQTLDVLFEQRADGEPGDVWEGLADNYVRVFAPSAGGLANDMRRVRVTAPHPDGVVGEIVG
jgi:threonylcarbamoyladenosine tRNA methylthiotransferase MtaB